MNSHTPDHIDCQACRERSVAGRSVLRRDMQFEAAFEVWMSWRAGVRAARFGNARKWSAGTVERYRQYGDAFCAKFGRVPLGQIGDGHLNAYAEERAAAGCGQNCIRKETDMVVRVLRDAHLWTTELDKAYKLLRLPMLDSDDQRALDEEQIRKLIEVLSRKSEESLWVLYDTIVALHTCTSTNERRLAKIRDVQLALRIFRVGPEQSKNKYRNRRVPLETEEVILALEWLLRRAKEKGATEPDHYLYPRRKRRGVYDATKPMTRWCLAQQFEGVGEEIGADDFTPYDVRHSALSMLANAGTPIDVILAYGGQVSEKMRQHYTTASTLAKSKAAPEAWKDVQLLDADGAPLVPKKQPGKVIPMRARSYA